MNEQMNNTATLYVFYYVRVSQIYRERLISTLVNTIGYGRPLN